MVLGLVHLLLENEEKDFNASKHMLGDSKFLTRLKIFDPSTVTPETKAKLAKALESSAVCAEGGGPDPGVVKKKSMAAEHLFIWVLAIHHELE